MGHSPSESDARITFHSFPQDETVRAKWIRAISRKDFVPTKHSRVCSLHFRETDFVEEHCDINTTLRKKLSASQLKLRHLEKDAVQSIFPSVPSYLTSPAVTPRSSASAACAASRRQKEGRRLEMLEESYTPDDVVESLTSRQIKDRLEGKSAVPAGF